MKDKVFQLLIFYCYVFEFIKILCEQYFENSVDLKILIFCLVIDGGLDYRVIFEIVKLFFV